jgi:hypothetical protein
VAFINNKYTIDWGVSISHIPYKYGYYEESDTFVMRDNKAVPTKRISLNIRRIFEDGISLFAIKPLSQTRRIEAYTSLSYYSQRLDRFNEYTNEYKSWANKDENLPVPDGFGIGTVGTAYTIDNSYLGIASPLRGNRFRVETEYYFGALRFTSFLTDYRKYFFINPICIATRLYHVGRYGSNSSNDVIRALYIGWPWLVRGFYNYDYYGTSGSINPSDRIDQLFGSRIAVANLELRIPFTGPARLCLIPFKYFISELSFFTDAGLAWNPDNYFSWKLKRYPIKKINYYNLAVSNPDNLEPYNDYSYSKYRYPHVSYGISLRINFFGYMVLEPYYAVPIEMGGFKNGNFGLNFLPGW